MRDARRATWLVALALAVPVAALATEHTLSVSADGRHLVQSDGRPFIHMEDTA